MCDKVKTNINRKIPLEIRSHSLPAKVVRSVLFSCILLAIMSLIAGCILYLIPAIQKYNEEGQFILSSMESVII